MKNRRPSGTEKVRASEVDYYPASGTEFTPWNPGELARVQEEAAKSGWHFVGRSDDGMLMFSRELP